MSSRKQVYKRLRKEFNQSVFERDDHTCRFCDATENLDAHHITDRSEMPFDGYVVENGITLCPEHHLKAEKFHMTDGDEWEENMHPSDLYDLIGSSKKEAIEESKKLSEQFEQAGVLTINIYDKYQKSIEREFDSLFSQISNKLAEEVTSRVEVNTEIQQHEQIVEYLFENLTADLNISQVQNYESMQYNVSVDLLFDDNERNIHKFKSGFITKTFYVNTKIE